MGLLSRFKGKLKTKKKKTEEIVCVNYTISTNFDEPRPSMVKQKSTFNSIKPPAKNTSSPLVPPKAKINGKDKELIKANSKPKIPETQESDPAHHSTVYKRENPADNHEYEEIDDSGKSTLIFMTESHDSHKNSKDDSNKYEYISQANSVIASGSQKRESLEEEASNTSKDNSIYQHSESPTENPEIITKSPEILPENINIKSVRFIHNSNEDNNDDSNSLTANNERIGINHNTKYFTYNTEEDQAEKFEINFTRHTNEEEHTDDEEDIFEDKDDNFVEYNGMTFSSQASSIFFGEEEEEPEATRPRSINIKDNSDNLSQNSSASA